jgi:peptide-methionine (S)-S-oxide reductase
MPRRRALVWRFSLRFSALLLVPALSVTLAVASSCSSSQAAEPLPKPAIDLPAAKAGEVRTAVFAAGCFWCTEAVFEHVEGVTDVVSGYAGGTKEDADYHKVGSGKTGHAEAIRITYDPSRVTYGQLLQVLFGTHDPTTKDRQGPDWGPQYRSAIFYANAEEKKVAEAYIKQLDAAKLFPAAIVTTLEPLKELYSAEEYHQNFVALHPEHGYVRQWAIPKLQKLVSKHPDLVKKQAK